MIDRVFTKAEARYIPNGPSSTSRHGPSDADRRPVVFVYPLYQFDAETPGTLVARSHSFGQHGYVPDIQDLLANINMRATFLAGGEGIAKEAGDRQDDRPCADARLHARDPGAAAQPGTGSCSKIAQGRQCHQADRDRGPERLPRSARPDDAHVRRARLQSVGGAAFLATMFDEETLAALPGVGIAPSPGSPRPGGDNVGASPPNSALLQGHARDRRRERVGDGRDRVRQPRVRLRPAAAPRSTRHGRTSPSSRRTSSTPP